MLIVMLILGGLVLSCLQFVNRHHTICLREKSTLCVTLSEVVNNLIMFTFRASLSEETTAMVVKFLLSIYSVKVDKKVSVVRVYLWTQC